MSIDCACGNNWRVEACDLTTGQVKAVLHPMAFDFQTDLNKVGQGTVQLSTLEILAREIFPHNTSIYIMRVRGGLATPENPIVEFAGMVDSFSSADSGSTTVGLKSIEEYLHHRLITETLSFPPSTQHTQIAKALVDHTQENGIPLNAIAEESEFVREETYFEYESKIVGDMIDNLVNIIDGPDWELIHQKNDGKWSTTMVFRDHVGIDRGVVIQSNREALGFSLEVDAQNHANYIRALGEGSEVDQVNLTVQNITGNFPRFDAAPSWSSVKTPERLRDHAEGYLEDYKEPIVTPNITLKGLEYPPPEEMKLGDVVEIRVNYGAVTFNGDARILSISWAVGVGEPETRTLELLPLTNAADGLLNQQPTDICGDC